MPTFFGPQPYTIKNGLFLYLDAEKYSGSGTTWSNLSGVLGGSLSDSPLWNGKSFQFNGSTQSASLSSFYGSITTPTNNFTYNIWALPTSTHEIDTEATAGASGVSGQKYLVGAGQFGTNAGVGISMGTNGVSVYEHGGGYMPALLVYSASLSTTKFTNVCVAYIDKKPKLYINGVLVREGLTSPKSLCYMNGGSLATGSYGNFAGHISVVQYYNRTLTDKEIMANYLYFKNRFLL
jgi:hypothetical protein